MDRIDLEGRVALVTGAGSGIGRACARMLAGAGARVLATDIDAGGLEETRASGPCASDGSPLAEGGGAIGTAPHDVTVESEWERVMAHLRTEAGRLDILVNNAGIFVRAPTTEMTLEQWRHQMAINVDGVFLGAKHAIPLMRETGGGSIVNLSSVAGLIGAPMSTGYSATKGAVRLFTHALAKELAGEGIRANSVHPGIIATPIWEKLPRHAPGEPAPDPHEVARRMVPTGRAASAEDVARTVLFLASDLSAYMTGAELVVDGGMTA